MFDAHDHVCRVKNGRKTLEIIKSASSLPKGERLTYGVSDSPFGPALLALHEGALVYLGFCRDDAEEKSGFVHPGYSLDAALDQLARRFRGCHLVESHKITQAFGDNIFSNTSVVLPLTLIGTDFQIAVWHALMSVEWGQAATYGDIAEELAKPNASRAVGSAVGANRIAWLIPCHRILSASGKLHNYHWGLKCKSDMLAYEREN